MVIRIITQNRNLKILNVKYDFVFRENLKLDTPCLRQLPKRLIDCDYPPDSGG